MNTMTKCFFVALTLAAMTAPALADGDECRPTAASHKAYEDLVKRAEAAEKAGRNKEAYEMRAPSSCPYPDSPWVKRHVALLKRTSLKLGEEAESKGNFTEAYEYFSEYGHGIAVDRVQMKIATAKPGHFETVRNGVNYFRDTQEYLSRSTAEGDPDRGARLKAISGYLGRLQAIATKNGEKFLSDEDKIFNARKTSVMAQSNSLKEIEKAQAWLGLFGQEKRANDRAVKRGDTLLADDSRKALQLAISYYELPHDRGKKNVRKVQEKARRLGDAHLRKGEKKLAAGYYSIAGLGDKAAKLEEANEAEKEKAEGQRQGQFKKDQDALEKALGM